MFRIQAFLFCSSTFFLSFCRKTVHSTSFGTGLISSILIFPQALISGTGSIVSVCCIPFRSVWLHLSAPAAQSYQVYLDTKPFISPRADKWYFVAQLAAALASWLSGYTWPNNSMLIGRGRDLEYNRATSTVTIRKPADRGNHQEKRAEWTRWLCEEKPIQYMKLLNLKEVSQFSFKTMQWRGTLDRCWQFVPKDRSSWQEWLHCTGFVNAREWIHMTTEITTTWQS